MRPSSLILPCTAFLTVVHANPQWYYGTWAWMIPGVGDVKDQPTAAPVPIVNQNNPNQVQPAVTPTSTPVAQVVNQGNGNGGNGNGGSGNTGSGNTGNTGNTGTTGNTGNSSSIASNGGAQVSGGEPTGQKVCDATSTITDKGYYVMANIWGGGAGGNGHQCAETLSGGSANGVAWQTEWSWQGNSVVSYAMAYPQQICGPLSSFSSIQTNWQWRFVL